MRLEHDHMDVGGRVAPGAATENESGDRVELNKRVYSIDWMPYQVRHDD